VTATSRIQHSPRPLKTAMSRYPIYRALKITSSLEYKPLDEGLVLLTEVMVCLQPAPRDQLAMNIGNG